MRSYTITFNEAQFKKLQEVLEYITDEGPLFEGWSSPLLQEVKDVVNYQESKSQNPRLPMPHWKGILVK